MQNSESVARQNLLDRLLNAVKQVQVHFGAREEVATEADLRVASLCTEWEAVLSHGMRRGRPKPGLRQTGRNTQHASALWPLANMCLSGEEQRRFLSLSHVKTDIGRGRAWLRAAINERTLENYLHSILSSEEALQLAYEPRAFLLDQEKSNVLPNMAAGLNSIIFSVSVDVDYLDSAQRAVEVPVQVPPLRMPLPPPPLLFSEEAGAEGEGVVAVSVRKKKKKKRSSHSTTVPHDKSSSPLPSPPTSPPRASPVGSTSGLLVEEGNSMSSTPSQHSLTSAEDSSVPTYVSLPPPADLQQQAAATGIGEEPAGPSVAGGKELSVQELRDALLVVVNSRDELTEENRKLEAEVLRECVRRGEVEREVEVLRGELQTIQQSHVAALQALERENDLLREQLKRYVEMVQGGSPSPSSQEKEQLAPVEKLSQMAELYGELMELNGRLHREVASKNAIISKIQQGRLEAPPPTPTAAEREPAIAVWIPSVIKKGYGPDGHHVYQVFVKIGSDEWNVYRRYADFRDFHKQLLQVLPQINAFNFPPKKVLGNKRLHIVEERRYRLQEYLRFVLNVCCTYGPVSRRMRRRNEPVLKPGITKSGFVEVLPFFKEGLGEEANLSPIYDGH